MQLDLSLSILDLVSMGSSLFLHSLSYPGSALLSYGMTALGPFLLVLDLVRIELLMFPRSSM